MQCVRVFVCACVRVLCACVCVRVCVCVYARTRGPAGWSVRFGPDSSRSPRRKRRSANKVQSASCCCTQRAGCCMQHAASAACMHAAYCLARLCHTLPAVVVACAVRCTHSALCMEEVALAARHAALDAYVPAPCWRLTQTSAHAQCARNTQIHRHAKSRARVRSCSTRQDHPRLKLRRCLCVCA